jgi:uncharacterized membrane protein
MVLLGDLPGDPVDAAATAVSADGSVVVGYGSLRPVRADVPHGDRIYAGFRWTEEGGMVQIDPGGVNVSGATGVTADGRVIVGFAERNGNLAGYHWTEEGGLEWTACCPKGISGDGSRVIGAYNEFGVSYDGSTVVGESGVGWEGVAYRRTEGGGTELLSPNGPRSRALATSGDGSVVVGWDFVGDLSAFIWDETHGYRSLRDVLTGLGLDLTGWELWEATGISPDGRHIVGSGLNPSGELEAWLVHLPIEAIPEASSAWLLGSGLAALLGLRRRFGR